MTPAAIAGYLTKKEVEEQYGRSHRSLTRDFSSAVRKKDDEVLTHLKLQTEDGTVRPGTEVTLEQIQEWSNQGLSPTWFVEGEWAAQRYGVRSESLPPREPLRTTEPPPRSEAASESRADLTDLVRRLDEQIQDLRQELKIKNEQIQQASDRTRESNVLMKELQTLLGNVQERLLLASPSNPTTDSIVPTTDAVEIVEQPAAVVRRPPPAKSRQKPEQGTARAKSKPSPAPVATKSDPKWYEMPTFKKLLHRQK